MNLMDIGERIALDILSGLPYTGVIAREWDSFKNDKRFKKIEQEITEIWNVIAKNPQLPLEGSIHKIIRLVKNNELVPDFDFRKAESCMILLKEINTRSKLGLTNDPFIKYEECIRIVKDNINTDDPEKELKLVVYELEKEDLIYKRIDMSSRLGFAGIGPTEYFFCKTDIIFQKWDPKSDAKEIVKLFIKNNQDSATTEELDRKLKWRLRRLNSAIVFLYSNKSIQTKRELGGTKYVLQWIRLTEEAYFFIEKDK